MALVTMEYHSSVRRDVGGRKNRSNFDLLLILFFPGPDQSFGRMTRAIWKKGPKQISESPGAHTPGLTVYSRLSRRYNPH